MLLWKDCRLNRMLFVLGVVLLLGPYLFQVLWTSYNAGPGSLLEARTWAILLLGSSFLSIGLSELTVLLLAGNAIACERADRSAEFLGYLPPSRARILASKATLVWLPALAIWGMNVLMAKVVAPAVNADDIKNFGTAATPFLLATIATGALFLGAAWLGSSFLESPSLAAGVGVLPPLVVISTLLIINLVLGWPGPDGMQNWYTGSCFVLGVVCFAAGTVYYLRRVEP
jgi:ABC-type transport system involved in multi-copper enzyme maturation permease subunit